MPSPYSRIKNKANPAKPGSLTYDLIETQKDINRAKRGKETEASMEEMRETKRRIKRELKSEIMAEEEAARKDALDRLREKTQRERVSA